MLFQAMKSGTFFGAFVQVGVPNWNPDEVTEAYGHFLAQHYAIY